MPGSAAPAVPGFRGLSVVLQAYDGDVDRTVDYYEDLGETHDARERELLRVRARCCWSWIELHAPDDFRYRIRVEPVVRGLSPDQRVVLERLVALLRARPGIHDAELVPEMKALCEGTGLTLKTFCPLAYDLLLDRDRGPKLTTLLTTLGGARALPLLEASLTSP